MGSLAVNPVQAEWLDAVYKITKTALPPPSNGNGTSQDGDTQKLKQKLAKKRLELYNRVNAIKPSKPIALVGKLDGVAEDIKNSYKLSTLEDRLKEIEEQVKTVEKEGFTGSRDWANEARKLVGTFEKQCQEAEGELVKKAQQKAEELAKTQQNATLKKRLLAAASESSVDFASVPLKRLSTRFEQDITMGEKEKDSIVSNYGKELEQTRKDIEKVIDGPKFLSVVRQEQKPRERQREADEVEKATGELKKKIARLAELDGARAKQYEEQLKGATTLKKVQRIDGDIDGSLKRRIVNPQEIQKKQKELNLKGKSIRNAKKGTKGDQRGKLRELQGGVTGAKALAGTGNKKVTEAAEKLAEQLEKAANDPKVAKVFEDIGKMTKQLEDKKMRFYFPKEYTQVSESLKKMSAAVDPLNIEPSQTEVAEAEKKVQKLVADTEVRVKWQEKTKQALNTVQARMLKILKEGLGVYVTKKSQDMGMYQKLKEIQAESFKADAVMATVDKQVKTLEDHVETLFKLKNAGSSGKKDLEKWLEYDKKEGAKLVKKRNDEAAALLKANNDRKALIKRLDVQKKRVKGDPILQDQVELVEQLLKAALQLSKAKDLAGMKKKVKTAGDKLDLVEGKEAGAAGKAKDYLKDNASKNWISAVGMVTPQIEEIKGEAVKLAKAENQDTGKVTAIIDKLIDTVFKPELFSSTFQAPIKQLLDAKDVNGRKAAREKVIAEIGYFRKQLESNEVLLQLRVNPLNKKISTTPLALYLNTLEFKCTEAVRGK